MTPPHWAELAAETLSGSVQVVVPNTGHGTLTRGCVPDLVTEFVAAAGPPTDDAATDTSCVDDVRRPAFFIDLLGPTH